MRVGHADGAHEAEAVSFAENPINVSWDVVEWKDVDPDAGFVLGLQIPLAYQCGGINDLGKRVHGISLAARGNDVLVVVSP